MARGMAQGSRLAKFRRITELFEEGRAVVLDPNPEDPVLVWVNKLNPFELEEARKDGSVGRARGVMRLDDEDAPEHEVYVEAIQSRTPEDMRNSLVNAKGNEHYLQALDDIRADEDWRPKLEVLERGDAQLEDAGEVDDDERSRLAKLNEAYLAEVERLIGIRQREYRAELDATDDEDIRRQYKEQYREAASSNGFLNEYRTTEMFFALRACDAKATDDGWDHSECDHRQRLCEVRSEIRDLPEQLLVAVREAMLILNMTPREAGNSGAPASSSASSGPRSEQAESTPSTPAEK